jgi:ATPase subunit of ABC transporter with duplicated ATPase domains
MLKVNNITKFYGPEKVLNKISFILERGHKVALVGFNGTGKSTLLKILAGFVDRDAGVIDMHKNATMGFLPQDSSDHDNENILEFLQKYVGENDEPFLRKIEIMFSGFALPSEIKFKKISELSSGQKTKVFLTGLLLKKVDLMLLDEPTNNLDLPALIWLEDFLKRTETAFIVVSHDRKFLDSVTNKIYEIDWKERGLRITNGKYSDYLAQKQKEMARTLLEHEMQNEEMHRLQKSAEQKRDDAKAGSKWMGTDNDKILRGFKRNRAGHSFRDSKVIYARLKRIEKIEKPNYRKDFKIEILPEDSGVSRDILIRDLVCGYDDGFRVGPINLEVPFGSRVCILGLNGSGKSTLLKTVTGLIPKISGEIAISGGVKIGNLMQEHESLPKKETLLGFLKKRTDLDDKYLHNHLLHFSFKEWQIKEKIETLSPGGRARLLLALFAATKVNVLVLDEPTNHLDMEAEDALEKSLAQFEGTVITVTHDRFFVEKNKTDSLYVLDNSTLNKIADFKEYVAEMEKKSKKLLRMLGK